MVQRSLNSHDAKLKALPFYARLRREEPFAIADDQEWRTAADRIAGPTGWYSRGGWREEAGFKLVHFASPAEADEMQRWIATSEIEARPVPKMGPSKEEIETERKALIDWAVRTGGGRAIVQAYRRSIFDGHGGITALCAAYKAAGETDLEKDGLNEKVETIIDWARGTWPEWFDRCRPPEAQPSVRSTTVPSGTLLRLPKDEPELPRWRPTF